MTQEKIEEIESFLFLKCGTDHGILRAYIDGEMFTEIEMEAAKKIFARCPHLAYSYSQYVGRFELGEPAIATNYTLSFYYAREVLNGRFELGEPIIASHGWISVSYALYVIKGRWEPGEEAITRAGAECLAQYTHALNIIEGKNGR